MTENHPGRENREARCASCGAEIEYTVVAEGEGEVRAALPCPSCGRAVESDGEKPKMVEFGPGEGQHGA